MCGPKARPHGTEMEIFMFFINFIVIWWKQTTSKCSGNEFVPRLVIRWYFSHSASILPFVCSDQMCCHIYNKPFAWAFLNSVFYDRQFRLINCHGSRSDFLNSKTFKLWNLQPNPISAAFFFVSRACARGTNKRRCRRRRHLWSMADDCA